MKLQKKDQKRAGESQHLITICRPAKTLKTFQMPNLNSTKSNIIRLPKSINSLPIFKVEKQSELEKKVDDWLGAEANRLIDDAEDGGETLDWDFAWEYAVFNLQNGFDKIDEDSELIEICKEDEPEKWLAQKLLILKYLKIL